MISSIAEYNNSIYIAHRNLLSKYCQDTSHWQKIYESPCDITHIFVHLTPKSTRDSESESDNEENGKENEQLLLMIVKKDGTIESLREDDDASEFREVASSVETTVKKVIAEAVLINEDK